ncbi:MAG: hypothetical protein JNJ80_01675 [Gemmatimonadetes bacterium]|nr:hypothetical protein [Gemmatimonadota bacterium]
MPSTIRTIITLHLIAAGACGVRPEGRPAATVTRVDSAGVDLVTTSGIEFLPRWVLDTVPQLSIGGAEQRGPEAFVMVAGALELADGSIVVSDLAPAAVFLFDSRGRFLRQLIRSGAGPGELRYAGGPIRLGGDSLGIFDSPQGRLVVLGGDFRHLATIQLVPFRGDNGEYAVPVWVVSSRDAIGFRSRLDVPRSVGVQRRPMVVGRIPFDGARFDSITAGRGIEIYQTASGMGWGVPMGAGSVFGIGRTAVYGGDTDESAVGSWTLDGRMTRSIRWVAPPDPVTADDWRRAVAAESTSLESSPETRRAKPEFRRSLIARLQSLPPPKQARRFTFLVPTDDGGVWIQRRPRRWLEVSEYLVADSTGALVARVDVPTRIHPFQIGPDWVLARFLTEDDVQLVRRYRLLRD